MSRALGSINSTQMIFAGSGQWFSPANLASFQAWANAPVIPAVALIGGHVNDSKCLVHSNCAEANLDMQYITTMPPYSPTTFWYTDEWFTTFMIAVLNTAKLPKVISISYGTSEVGMPAGVFQNMERGDGGRQYLHVFARGRTDLPDGVAGGPTHLAGAGRIFQNRRRA